MVGSASVVVFFIPVVAPLLKLAVGVEAMSCAQFILDEVVPVQIFINFANTEETLPGYVTLDLLVH